MYPKSTLYENMHPHTTEAVTLLKIKLRGRDCASHDQNDCHGNDVMAECLNLFLK